MVYFTKMKTNNGGSQWVYQLLQSENGVILDSCPLPPWYLIQSPSIEKLSFKTPLLCLFCTLHIQSSRKNFCFYLQNISQIWALFTKPMAIILTSHLAYSKSFFLVFLLLLPLLPSTVSSQYSWRQPEWYLKMEVIAYLSCVHHSSMTSHFTE